MSAKYQPGRKTALLYLLGILFCVLSITFAVTSKVAAYYPHNDATRPITAAKMWQQQNTSVTYAPPVQAATAPLLFVFVLVLIAATEAARSYAWMQASVEAAPALQLYFSRANAIRPPPQR